MVAETGLTVCFAVVTTMAMLMPKSTFVVIVHKVYSVIWPVDNCFRVYLALNPILTDIAGKMFFSLLKSVAMNFLGVVFSYKTLECT